MIVTLCGSLKFEDEYKAWDERLTLCGHTVFTCSVYPSYKAGEKNWYDVETKAKLDAAHIRKIDLSDVILVICPGGYIGQSTAGEIQHAKNTGKQVCYTYPVVPWYGIKEPERRICHHKGCYDPLLQQPPCALCYE